MEQGIGLGSAIFGLGLLLDLVVVLMFLRNMLDGYDGVRVGIVALTFSVIGLQIVFSSFFLSMMAIHRRGWDD
jgi:UDP-N-acetylmuramyl pentapeptide phosphotransferase/UDP-N-acetylglucosamine-1-phosphate transferase